ncbi:hypothetical protein NW761_004515 [Fusarium oxysporum]|nr:hypothetical protein NW758_003515 [Fusarium oxysporum]KAJ4058232.1 hypothetical protein NW753_005899 [Fusarium oxysporum]KAJ4068576.1 hypothetical protein NW763_002136 [Fusarium oxysporum]KAJ4079340.1 hypothetical protein NW756_011306 [Fusarium oxysporum]KAJ4096553.1 hypothetical protein NW761_004515 [Fusarium oxysporum]
MALIAAALPAVAVAFLQSIFLGPELQEEYVPSALQTACTFCFSVATNNNKYSNSTLVHLSYRKRYWGQFQRLRQHYQETPFNNHSYQVLLHGFRVLCGGTHRKTTWLLGPNYRIHVTRIISPHRSILCRITYVPLYFDHIRMDTYERFDLLLRDAITMQILLLFEVRISECTTPSQIGRVLDETTNNYRPEMQSPLGANMGKDNHSQLDLLRQKWPPARVLAWYVPCRLVICNGWVWG